MTTVAPATQEAGLEAADQLEGSTFTRIVNEATADTSDQNWGAEHMYTHVELHIEYRSTEDEEGNIVATPVRAFLKGEDRTWTNLVLQGFHGNSQVELEPTAYQSANHRYGVDGVWIGQSDRTDVWVEEVPLATAQADRASKGGVIKITFRKG